MSVWKKISVVLCICLSSFAYALGMFEWESTKQDESGTPSKEIASLQSCDRVIVAFNRQKLDGKIDAQQLTEIIRALNKNNRLPSYFVTKREARRLGWQPGVYFHSIEALRGKSIGGDVFKNYEQHLPAGSWKEADLDYQGYRRNAKRLVFSVNGSSRYVTIDHYQTFYRVPDCN